MNDVQWTRRRIMGALAVAGTGGVLAACSGSGASTSGANRTTEPAGARKTLPPATLAMFSNWGGQTQRAAQEQALALFQQENPGVTVELTTGAANADKVLSAITAGVPPHLVTQNPQRLIPLAGKGTWRPLEDFVKTSSVVKKENYADAQFKLFTWKGKLYGVPGFEHFGGYALSYNMHT